MSADIARLLRAGRRLRTLGIDDGPFRVGQRPRVLVVGALYNGAQFDGLLSCRVRQDGRDATEQLRRMICGSKFAAQIHFVMLDGICVAGLNVVDLPRLAEATGLACATVMRRAPDLPAMHRALARLPDGAARGAELRRAGPIHSAGTLRFQVAGLAPDVAAAAIRASVAQGKLPECLRAAHLIGAGIVTGQSGRRA